MSAKRRTVLQEGSSVSRLAMAALVLLRRSFPGARQDHWVILAYFVLLLHLPDTSYIFYLFRVCTVRVYSEAMLYCYQY
jgi:hypothetical protein